MDKIDLIMTMIGGTSGAGVIVAMLVGFVKTIWKPGNKKLYWVPAGLLSLGSTVGIFWYLEILNLNFWIVLLLLIFAAYTALYEYIANNEQWVKFKPRIIELLKKIFGMIKD